MRITDYPSISPSLARKAITYGHLGPLLKSAATSLSLKARSSDAVTRTGELVRQLNENPSQAVSIGGRFTAKRIYQGVVSNVYLGRNDRTGELVAIKESADEVFDHLLAGEAAALSRLEHPNIVRYIGLIGEPPKYLVEEFVFGCNAAELYASGQLTSEESVAIYIQAIDVLAFAHQAGVCHNDLNVNNLMIDRNGGFKMIDFNLGIAEPAKGEAERKQRMAEDIFSTVNQFASVLSHLHAPDSPLTRLIWAAAGVSNPASLPYRNCAELLGAILRALTPRP